MSETAIQVADPKVTVPAVAKAEKAISDKAAKEAMREAKFARLEPIKLKAEAKTGRYIEQLGEHHMARAYLTNSIANLSEYQRQWAKKAQEALDTDNEKDYLKYSRLSAYAQDRIARIAMNLHRTRRKTDASDAPMENRPTMPARTVITNNTQINVHPKPEPNGNPT